MTKIRVAIREDGNPFTFIFYILSDAKDSNPLPQDNGRCP